MAEQKESRKPKGPINFKVKLSEEQKEGKAVILDNIITVVTGEAGSGKTMLASQVALDMLIKKMVSKIILTRAAVTAGEELGFLPGDKDEKLKQYVLPILENMEDVMVDKKNLEKRMMEGEIEISPVAFMRGKNLKDAVVIIDECQNLTTTQTKLILTRICSGTKVIMCGDMDQVDLPYTKKSGFQFVCEKLAGKVKGFAHIHLKENHRDPAVEEILKVYKEEGE